MTITELCTILKTSSTVEEIDLHRKEIIELIPVAEIMIDYDQMNHAHQYDLWFHCLHTVINLPRNLDDDMLYLAALLHDIGKPESRCAGKREDDTNMHYYGHPEKSLEIVRDEIIPAWDKKGETLGLDDARRLMYYVAYHDDHVSVKLKSVRRHIAIASFEEFQKLMLLEIADAKAHIILPIIADRIEKCTALSQDEGRVLYQRILAGE